ncbi:hypothetical protein MLD38_030974 [Melastoma candidum]|uniref:Uncharacterized protein n=1 Tax=Melastoma candidum TaxID=119954 RepID=A0ACB9MNB3_9MYRT|nr:hypothetical protein MLD38_030974 [Melastoma candidum]
MTIEDFDAQALSDKLSKLNSSQQSIESLSQWCLSHRKKAKDIVETWDKLFKSSQKDKRISFLYLSNDILQNSRRQGSEFVNEFWKVLPAALRLVNSGDEHGKKVAARLVDIWEERKVFGSRGRGLKNEMLGKDPHQLSVSNGKASNPIKIVKRDPNTLRVKLSVGDAPEKILTAFHLVFDERSTEEAALNKCNVAGTSIGKIEEDAESLLIQGSQEGEILMNDLHEQEAILKQCIAQLENAEAARAALAAQLRDALSEQELKTDLIRIHLQSARAQVDQANNLRRRLASPTASVPMPPTSIQVAERPRMKDQNLSIGQSANLASMSQLAQTMMSSITSSKSTEEENKKAAVAAVAAKLSASSSSALMLSSVLSSLVAEEVALNGGGQKTAGLSTTVPVFPPEKKPRLEKDSATSSYFAPLQPQPPKLSMPLLPPASMQLTSQSSQIQPSFASPPPPPPLPPQLSGQSSGLSGNQFLQSAGLASGVMPFQYGANLPPPPPLPPHISKGLARPGLQPPQKPQADQPLQQQQQPGTGGYYQPQGVGFFGRSHQAAAQQSVPRQ